MPVRVPAHRAAGSPLRVPAARAAVVFLATALVAGLAVGDVAVWARILG